MKPKILIATNSRVLNKKIYSLILKTQAYEILPICNKVVEVEEALSQEQANIAFLSVQYKNGSGVAMSGKLHLRGGQTQIVLLSTSEDITLMRLALEYGVRGYFNFEKDRQIYECLDALKKNEYYIETKLYHAHYYSRVG